MKSEELISIIDDFFDLFLINNFFMGRFKKRELLNFGIDYFKGYLGEFEFKKTKLSKLGLSKNSNFAYIDDNTFIELQPKDFIKDFGFVYTIRDKQTQTNLAFLGLSNGLTNGAIKRESFFEVSGQGLELRGGPDFYIKLLKFLGFDIYKFVRVDVYFDLGVNVDYIVKNILKDKIENKTKTFFYNGDEVETLYIGQKKKTANTYQLLRVYNKKLDSHKKGKSWIYDYDNKKDVSRFEIEIRRDKAKFWTVEKLLDEDYIFGVIVKTWYPYNYQFFKFLHLEDFKKIQETKSLYYYRLEQIVKRQNYFLKYGKDFFDDKEENKTIKTWISFTKRLEKNGYNLEKLVKIYQNALNCENFD